MKFRIPLIACVLLISVAHASVPAFVKSGTFGASTAATITPSNAGDTIIVGMYCEGGGSISSVTDSSGQTPVQDFSTTHFAGYRVTNATVTAHTFTMTSTCATALKAIPIEVSGLGGFDKSVAENSGTSTSPVTNSLTPAANDEFFYSLVLTGSGTATFSAWTNSFTVNHTLTTGPSLADAYLVQTSGPTALTSGVTLSTSESWVMVLAAYSPGAACTHSGITSAGAISVPNGSSGSYQGKSGSFVTPDCGTVNYKQPTVGNFAVN